MQRQLRVLKNAGLGGAHIIPWPSTPAYLSPEWLQLLGVAAQAARDEGMVLDMSANASWPFRGDWVPVAESLHKVEVEVHHLEGPSKFSLPAKNAESKKAKGKAAKNNEEEPPRILLAQLAPDTMTGIEQLRDVTSDLALDTSPVVDVPKGKHTLYVVRLLAGVKSQAGFGRVPDHFNGKAIENYLKGFTERVAPALGGKLSNGLRAMYCDSIEISEANWTPNFPGEFKRRHGYDLMPYLPLVLDLESGSKPPATTASNPLNATIARVRYDYCRTLVDLFLEGLGQTFYRWCHENGTLCRWQAYGWPLFYGIEDGYRIPDMPEGNNWLFVASAFDGDVDVHGWPIWQKYTSSGAHQAGRRIASTEAMTATLGLYQETLDLVKRADDFNFICGINHSFLHGFCYSPAQEPFPGRSQYGTYFSEQNTWWPYMRRWMDYNARLSAVFQASKPVSQVALLFRTGDVWGQGGLHRHPFQMDPPWAHQVWRWINQNGANADYVSDQVLQEAKFEGGKLGFGPMRYDALVVLGAHTLVPATAQALERYAQAGGRIVFVGGVPEFSPSLKDAEANDRMVRQTMQGLLKKYPQTVICRNPPGTLPQTGDVKSWLDLVVAWRKSANPEQCLSWADDLLTTLHVPRSVQYENPSVGLGQIHYRHQDGRQLYFFANPTPSNLVTHATFPGAGKRIEHWNPETMTRTAFPSDKTGRVRVELPPGGSLLLVAGEGEGLAVSELPPVTRRETMQKISGPWSVDFKPAKGDAFAISPFELVSLSQSEQERLTRFSGQAVYRNHFTWDKSTLDKIHLDLGEVPNSVTEVTLNGKALGARWYGSHEYVLDGALQQGENRLDVKVVTTLFNCQRKDKKAEPSGLVGPVTLQSTTQVKVQ